MRRLVAVAGTIAAVALAAAAATPVAARIPAPSLFGLNTGTFDPNYAHYVRDLPAARGLGARWVHFTGSLVKARRGRPGFSPLDSPGAGAPPRRACVRARRRASRPLPAGGTGCSEGHQPGGRRQRAARLEGRADRRRGPVRGPRLRPAAYVADRVRLAREPPGVGRLPPRLRPAGRRSAGGLQAVALGSRPPVRPGGVLVQPARLRAGVPEPGSGVLRPLRPARERIRPQARRDRLPPARQGSVGSPS